MISVEAVIEVPLIDPGSPWPIADLPAFSWLRIWGGMMENEIGLAVYQLVKYNSEELGFEENADDILRRLLNKKNWVLPGGLRLQNQEGKSITPGCCCGLENWREWNQTVESGFSPWLGHDPWPWVESLDTTIRVWADQNSDIFVDIERDDLISKLSDIEGDLMAFLNHLEKWVDKIDPQLTRSFTGKFDSCFSIRGKL